MSLAGRDRRAILIVAPVNDIHAVQVSAELERTFATPCIVWDRGEVPLRDAISFVPTAREARFNISAHGQEVSSHNLLSIWWRRPLDPRIDDAIKEPSVRRFCQRETDILFRGLLDAIEVPVINDPVDEWIASRKPFQLHVAHEIGFGIPDTLITNDPGSVRSFWERHAGNCIYKSLSPAPYVLAETRMLGREDIGDLMRLKHAPIIVQEKIEGADIRVNVFGEDVYAAIADVRAPQAAVDWRLDLDVKWATHELPGPVARRLRGLLDRLNLHYGCIDLRRRLDGAYVFLEVNPSGQFLFIEEQTSQPLKHSLSKLLSRPYYMMQPAHIRPSPAG